MNSVRSFCADIECGFVFTEPLLSGKSAKNCPGRFARSIESEVSPLSVLVLILAVLTLIVLVLTVLLILLILLVSVLILIVLVILVGHCFSSYGARPVNIRLFAALIFCSGGAVLFRKVVPILLLTALDFLRTV